MGPSRRSLAFTAPLAMRLLGAKHLQTHLSEAMARKAPTDGT